MSNKNEPLESNAPLSKTTQPALTFKLQTSDSFVNITTAPNRPPNNSLLTFSLLKSVQHSNKPNNKIPYLDAVLKILNPMCQRTPLINRPLKHRCVYIHKQDLLASQRAVQIKAWVPEGGALLSLVTCSSHWAGDVTTTWGCLVPNIHTAQEFLRDLLDTLTASNSSKKFCSIPRAQF